VGPWHDYPSLEPYQLDVKDRAAYLKTRYRYANLANYQLQLCQPGAGDTPQWRFLQERGEGVFHLGFTVPDLDAAESAAKACGLGVISRGRLVTQNTAAQNPGSVSGFTYFDTAQLGAGTTLEVRCRKDV